jgi:hypothetical protein
LKIYHQPRRLLQVEGSDYGGIWGDNFNDKKATLRGAFRPGNNLRFWSFICLGAGVIRQFALLLHSGPLSGRGILLRRSDSEWGKSRAERKYRSDESNKPGWSHGKLEQKCNSQRLA